MSNNSKFSKEKAGIIFPKMQFWCNDYPSTRCPTLIEPFILLILCQKPLCGYEILQILTESGIEYKIEEHGFLYKTLKILQKKKYILPACSLDLKTEAIIKTNYYITNEGKERLKHWMKSLYILKEGFVAFLDCCEKTLLREDE